MSECYYGNVHDITILRESGLLEHVSDSVQIIADKGYVSEDCHHSENESLQR